MTKRKRPQPLQEIELYYCSCHHLGLIDNPEISLVNSKPQILRNLETYSNIQLKTSPFVVEKNLAQGKYRLKVTSENNNLTIDELVSRPGLFFKSDSRISAKTTRAKNGKVLSSTFCEVKRSPTITIDVTELNKCMTITPSLCAGLRSFLKPGQKLAETAAICSDFSSKIMEKFAKLVENSNFQREEAQNIDRINSFAHEVAPQSKFRSNLFGLLDFKGGLATSIEDNPTGKQVHIFESEQRRSIAIMSHVSSLAEYCEKLEGQFAPEEGKLNSGAPVEKAGLAK